MKTQKEKPTFKDSVLWSLKMLGACWGAWLISIIPLYIFRGLYNFDASRLFWEELIMAFLGIIISPIIIYIFAIKTDYFEKAEKNYVRSLAIKSSVIYAAVCVISMGYYPVSVTVSHISRFLLYLSGGSLGFIALILASAMLNALFAVAIIKGAAVARKRREKFQNELHREKVDNTNKLN